MIRYRSYRVVEAAKVVATVCRYEEASRDWQLDDGTMVDRPQCEAPADPVGGYYARYADGSASWLSAEVFEASCRPVADKTRGLSFGDALEAAKWGEKIARDGWNGKGMWVEIQRPDAHSKMTLPYLYLNYPPDAANTPGARVPWLASQTDILANDWRVLSA